MEFKSENESDEQKTSHKYGMALLYACWQYSVFYLAAPLMNRIGLQTILTVIPVVSAGLYLLGATYHQGYLDGFGVDDSLFLLAPDRSLLLGFFSLISFAIVPMIYTGLAIVLLILAAVIAAVLSSTEKAKSWQVALERKFKRGLINRQPSQKVVNLLDKSATLYIYIVGIALLFIILLAIAVLSLNGGREQASKEIKDFETGKGNYVNLKEKSQPASVKAKQITCGISHCAYWLGNEAIILRHEDVDRVTAHKSKH